ncbi:hypothetical protein EPO05_03325 [Patescibacteria group bacterium]|nr:MAG: hypothetical protein EPO05_03325 [Patescibacteria group bacterium]
MSKELYNQHQFWILGQIKDKCESAKSDVITYNLAVMSAREGAPDIDTQRDIILALRHDGIIQIIQNIFSDDIFVQPKSVSGGFEIEPTGFSIKILHPKFEKKIENLARTIPSSNLSFDTNKSILYFFGAPIEIPAYKNEYYFCKIVFSHKKGELVSWDEIYEEMTGEEFFKKEEKFRKSVMDTMRLLNKRIKEKTKTEKLLFSRKNNMIRRNF